MLLYILFVGSTVLVSGQSDFKGKRLIEGEVCVTPSNEEGLCAPFTECASVMHLVDTVKDESRDALVQYLPNLLCSFKNAMPIVCCPVRNVSNENTWINDPSCGVSTNARIMNGREAELYQFPWMALLRYQTGSSYNYLCGGTLISYKYVLTAAHCVKSTKNQTLVAVRLGEHDLRNVTDFTIKFGKKFNSPGVQDFNISKVIVHSQFNNVTLENDIALIRLDGLAKKKANVRTVCLPIGVHLNTTHPVVLSGWGVTEEGVTSPYLKMATVPLVLNDVCHNIYNSRLNVTISYTQMCTDATEADSCSGDSGGPLSQGTLLGGDFKMVQFGITSYGTAKCQRQIPSIYTRVEYFVNWILDNMEE